MASEILRSATNNGYSVTGVTEREEWRKDSSNYEIICSDATAQTTAKPIRSGTDKRIQERQ